MVWNITGKEYPLKDLFSKAFDFDLPPYQRPYSWTERQARQLLNDLIHFSEQMDSVEDNDSENPNGNSEEMYFLGSIVLKKKESERSASIIDGQQRIITLTILLAAINFLTTNGKEGFFHKYIWEPGDVVEKLEAKPRLALNKVDQSFFEDYIQNYNFNELLQLNINDIKLDNDSKKNILKNSKYFVNELRSIFNDKNSLLEFGSMIVNYCYIVVVSTPTIESAFQVFGILNDRGLDLQHCDLIKSEIVGNLEESKQTEYADKWESQERKIGRENFDNFIGHIRMILLNSVQKKSVREEMVRFLQQNILEKDKFFDDILMPYLDLFYNVRNNIVKIKESESKKVNDILWYLNKIGFEDWMSPALLFLRKYEELSITPLEFFKKLERLSFFLLVSKTVSVSRKHRYVKIVQSLNKNAKSIENIDGLELSHDELNIIKNYITEPIYNNFTNNATRYILLRLEYILSNESRNIDRDRLYIDRILPQDLIPGSEWNKKWTNQHWKEYLNSIANLHLLPTPLNSDAINMDFSEKKVLYQQILKDYPYFKLTEQLVSMDSFEPADLNKRQANLIELLVKS